MKNNYSRPELEVVSYNVENVITTNVSSIFTTTGDNGTDKKDKVESVNYADIFNL